MPTHSRWYSHVRLVYNKRVLPRIDNRVREDKSKRKCCKCWRAAWVPIRFVTKIVSLSCDAIYSPCDFDDIDTDSFPRPWLGNAIRVTSTTFWEKQTLVNADRRQRWLLFQINWLSWNTRINLKKLQRDDFHIHSHHCSVVGVFTWREPVKCQSVRQEARAPTTTSRLVQPSSLSCTSLITKTMKKKGLIWG